MRSLKMIGMIGLIQLLSSCVTQTQSKLTIATASNLQFVMAELSQTFSQSTGIPCEIVLSSSGKLTAQIQAGAPYDVLLSADMKYPNTLHQAGLTHEKPQVYAFGQLVLWTLKESTNLSLSSLTDSQIQRIAIANPKTAPYGQAALSSLETAGITKQVKSKLVYGEAIAQVNQFITTQSVDVGLTAKSVVLSPHLTGKGTWVDVPSTSYPSIAQGIAILKTPPSKLSQSRKFQAFLFSPPAQKILKRFGYRINHS